MKKLLRQIYGWGIMLALFTGGLSFAGYAYALYTGGETAEAVCTFIYKTVYPELVYWTSWVVLLGIIRSYMKD
ncbi:MAG: hypothetical protein IJR85_05075 [Synergistaceae bacterium]|nr:hypothetical protein [Synergistaceae bacterium]